MARRAGQPRIQWLRLMARIKYDSYEDFRAGARFLERLAVWLQQFKQEDRKTAYQFVKDRLIYIGRHSDFW